VGDVVSLLGRIFDAVFLALVVVTLSVTSPLQAAPFAAIVMDGRTGEVLYEKNADARLHPASLTKMMTLYITFQEIEAGRISLDTMVTVTKYAASQPPSRLGLKPGQKIAVRYLIRAAAIKSANDAAATLGDFIGGSHEEFAKRMTRTARQLGMVNTTFKNANGLTAEGHLSTARDMNILGRHLFYDFPQYYHIFSRRTADAGVATVANTNTRFLDGYEGADGIKTGYTAPAGFNLTASAHRGTKHIIATIFGGTSTANRNAKMAELMDLGFEKAKGNVKEQPPVAAPMDEALIASVENGIDEIDAVGGAGKIVRVSGAVSTSPRPKARPDVATVSDDVAIAMAAGIDGALSEATAAPAPAGTLEFQAAAMTDPAAIPTDEPADQTALAAADPVLPAADDTQLAAAEPVAVVADPGTFDAQAAALAAGNAPAETPPVETLVADLPAADTSTLSEAVDPALADKKPKARPEGMTVQLATVEPAADPVAPAVEPEVTVAEAAPVAEVVVTDPGTEIASDAPVPLLADVTEVETVAAPATVGPAPTEMVAAVPATKRSAPIFDSVAAAEPEPALVEDEEVVVVMSTSGGRHFGVNVGEYPTRYDAEKALLKTALAESATLNDGLRKTSQSGGKWRASFMGLTEEQASLACRRLSARAIPCETVGG
jgi:D-alanyl-D-alanine carboxypeptidase